MAAGDALARGAVEAGGARSLTTAVLGERSGLGTPRRVGYLAGHPEAERASREASRRAALPGRCALPAPKTLGGHDWPAVSRPEGMGRESPTSPEFPERREDLVPMGDVGCGKTHMAPALRSPACEAGPEARFFTASSLVMRLRRARDEGRLDRESEAVGRARLLVIDEPGFLPLDPDGGAPAVPGVRGRLRAAVRGDHHQPRVRQAGLGARRRPDGGRRHRPRRPPRQAHTVPRGVVQGPERPDAGGVAAQKRCARRVRGLLRNGCSICSKTVDETQL